MARFSGVFGYGVQTEVSNGVWEDTIVERSYQGDVVQVAKWDRENNTTVNDDLMVNQTVSIVISDNATGNFLDIRYVRWSGVLWKPKSVEVQHPRLLVRLGEPYHGPVAAPSTP